LQHTTIPVELLDGHTKNYLKHPPEQIKRLTESLKRFSQVRSIVVRKNGDRYTVLAGHGIVEAARACKFDELRCDIVPDEWDDATAQAYLVADNAHAKAAIADDDLLLALIQEDKQSGGFLASLGSSEKELAMLTLQVKNSHATDFLHEYTQPVQLPLHPAGPLPTPMGYEEQEIFHPQEYAPSTLVASPPQEATRTEEQLFPLTYTFTHEQREKVLTATKRAKAKWGLTTSTDALVALCDEWVRFHDTSG